VVDPSTEAGLAVAKGSATFTQCRDTATGGATVVNAVLAEPVSESLFEEYAGARRARLFRLGGQGGDECEPWTPPHRSGKQFPFQCLQGFTQAPSCTDRV
jgi:hypothetical protein